MAQSVGKKLTSEKAVWGDVGKGLKTLGKINAWVDSKSARKQPNTVQSVRNPQKQLTGSSAVEGEIVEDGPSNSKGIGHQDWEWAEEVHPKLSTPAKAITAPRPALPGPTPHPQQKGKQFMSVNNVGEAMPMVQTPMGPAHDLDR
jgi:hypothetical protein